VEYFCVKFGDLIILPASFLDFVQNNRQTNRQTEVKFLLRDYGLPG